MATPAPLSALRETGRTEFAALGLPTRRLEDWRYSDLAQSLATPPAADDAAAWPSPILAGASVAAFVDGILDPDASTLPEAGVTLLRPIIAGEIPLVTGGIGQINAQAGHPILCLNAAAMEDGLILRVPAGTTLAAPLHLRFVWSSAGQAGAGIEAGRHVRVLVVLEDGAAATIVESHVGSPTLATVVTEARLAPSARLTHLRLERMGATGRQSSALLAEIGRDAHYDAFYLSEGAHFARHEALVRLADAGAVARIDGVVLATGSRHGDNTTVVTHAGPHTESRQTFRAVLGGAARGVYQGRVAVAPGALGTDARQMSRTLLLSRAAAIATKPELEILADDVKCAHGATVGELDAAALFFLRARGIPEAQARAMLVEAFLAEALSAIAEDGVRGLAEAAVQDWLSRHAGEVSHVV